MLQGSFPDFWVNISNFIPFFSKPNNFKSNITFKNKIGNGSKTIWKMKTNKQGNKASNMQGVTECERLWKREKD